MVRALSHAPAELTQGRLLRLGEGIGKVVYASPHWVVKRERTPSQIVALIGLWRLLRRAERFLPRWLGRRLVERPSRQIHLLRLLMQGGMVVLPRAFWFTSQIREVWKNYYFHDARGQRLRREKLVGSDLIPEEVEFPSVRVRVGGWPGYLTISKATERVETTLYDRIEALAQQGRFEEVEEWLDRFLLTRRAGWSRGLFSLDAHLKNYGVVGDRVVLIDAGGLTNDWSEIERRLEREAEGDPHVRLGLAKLLEGHEDLAARFDEKWRNMVNAHVVREILEGRYGEFF